jgi:hypothetical protein
VIFHLQPTGRFLVSSLHLSEVARLCIIRPLKAIKKSESAFIIRTARVRRPRWTSG